MVALHIQTLVPSNQRLAALHLNSPSTMRGPVVFNTSQRCKLKVQKIMKPVTGTIHDVLDTGRDLLARDKCFNRSEHLQPWGKSMKFLCLSTIAVSACAVLTFVTFRKVMAETQKHQEWKRQDQDLDRDLDSTFDASDPIAKY